MENNKLRVMTFNIRHAQGMDGEVSLQNIAFEIQRSGADLIGLQEVDRFLPRSNLKDQPAELARLLEMNFCYSASEDRNHNSNASAYIREQDAKTGLNGQYGNAILSRFPITAHQFQYLPGDNERRSLLHAEIEIQGRRVTFFNTHLGMDKEEQRVQVAAILEAIEKSSGALVLLGDFNMEPDNPLIAALSSAIRKVHLGGSVTTFAGKKDVVKEIDHLFTNLALEKDSAWTQPTLASDHHPVLAQLKFE
jgi:endonuclease/exonuclease/phosphatase family metal-dependent hydrolase